MRKSQQIISFARNTYRDRLSLVIDDYNISSPKKFTFLAETPKFQKTLVVKKHDLLIGQECIRSPFQIQPQPQKHQRKRSKTFHEVVSPKTGQQISPSPKPKAIISMNQFLQTKTLSNRIMTSPETKTKSNTIHEVSQSNRYPNRFALTERSIKLNTKQSNIPQSPLKKLTKSKQRSSINYQINKISSALNKCKQSLENIFGQNPKPHHLPTTRNKTIIQNQDYNFQYRQLFLRKKYPQTARK